MNTVWIVVAIIAAAILVVIGFSMIPDFGSTPQPQPSATTTEPNQQSGTDDGTAEVPADIAAMIEEKRDLIRVTTPQPLATVTTPVQVTGEARGYWFFEASFPIVITDWDGRIIGEGFATADGDWMTESFVPFSGTVEIEIPEGTPYSRGSIILQRANASGLPENDDALEFSIQLPIE